MAAELIIDRECNVYSDFDEWPATVRMRFNKADVTKYLKFNKVVRDMDASSVEDHYYADFLDEGGNESEFRSECNYMSIGRSDFYCKGIVKHTEPAIHWESSIVSMELLEESYKVWSTPKKNLPLLMGSLKHKENEALLEQRMKNG